MITMQLEEITQEVLNETDALTTDHYVECACWQDKIKLNVDYNKYITLGKAGAAKLYVLRSDGTMIGYMMMFLSNHPHYKEDVFAHVDVIYLSPYARTGMTAIKFMKYVEAETKKNGASVMSYHIKSFHDYPAIFERLGYEKVEVIYGKCLKL